MQVRKNNLNEVINGHLNNGTSLDPFEERHPSRVDPDCQLGLLLKAYFKKESLVQEVFNQYLKENFFTRAGMDKSSFDLNVAACRLVLDILPGLEIGVLNDTDGMILLYLLFRNHGMHINVS